MTQNASGGKVVFPCCPPIKLVGVAYQKEKVNKHFCAVECLLTNGGDFTFEIVRNV